MSVFKNLFARSPFGPLQSHMEKVAICVKKVEELYEAHREQDFKRMEKLAEEISELEHAADLVKNEIRNNLPKGLFLAVNRGDLLEILSLQDHIADKAEDIGLLLTIKKNLEPLKSLEKEIKKFVDKNIEAANYAHQIMRELDELLEASFGGMEAEKVKTMVEEVAYLEHQADKLQRELYKKLYKMEKELPVSSFLLWNEIFKATASISNSSEKLANRVRMLLEI